ncbi:unnamed protein product [Prorocentrum cordatum]|uniref:Uncharacterized protein n=1 Tax=Prorocentrum cordatum TaxID=2364126 RepID=A0ABN9U6W5_9DINO|nr:unnamed protein product [Polarella glacialis]
MFPPFTTFVHALLALILDPFAYVWKSDDVPSIDSQCGHLEEGVLPVKAQQRDDQHHSMRLRRTQVDTVSSQLGSIEERAEGNTSAEFKEKYKLPLKSKVGLWALTAIFCLCCVGWTYVAKRARHDKAREMIRFMPFSAFSMYSSYPSAPLAVQGWWDQSMAQQGSTTVNWQWRAWARGQMPGNEVASAMRPHSVVLTIENEHKIMPVSVFWNQHFLVVVKPQGTYTLKTYESAHLEIHGGPGKSEHLLTTIKVSGEARQRFVVRSNLWLKRPQGVARHPRRTDTEAQLV